MKKTDLLTGRSTQMSGTNLWVFALKLMISIDGIAILQMYVFRGINNQSILQT
jgi:hypothetical protein